MRSILNAGSWHSRLGYRRAPGHRQARPRALRIIFRSGLKPRTRAVGKLGRGPDGRTMDYHVWHNLAALFFERAAEKGDRPFLWEKRGSRYEPISWRETAQEVSAMARGLKALGVKRGDRVALVSENRPHWMIADLAVMAAGAITVPAYTTNTVDDHRHILANSGARAVIISKDALALRVIPAADQVTTIENIITIEPLKTAQVSHAEIHAWSDVVALGTTTPDDIAAGVAEIGRNDTACLIY